MDLLVPAGGNLEVPPEYLMTDSGDMPPVLHVDTDAPLFDSVDGSLVTDELWGIYYKPDLSFGGVQGGAMPYVVERPASEVAVDPYGPASADFVVGNDFARMWTSALAHCHKRFEDKRDLFSKEPSGGLGCFTPDSFPVFDTFNGERPFRGGFEPRLQNDRCRRPCCQRSAWTPDRGSSDRSVTPGTQPASCTLSAIRPIHGAEKALVPPSPDKRYKRYDQTAQVLSTKPVAPRARRRPLASCLAHRRPGTQL